MLTFSKAFSGNILYAITLKNVADAEGNTIKSPQTLNFNYFTFNKLAVVINELMPDPNPPIDLPDAEYIELYNTTKQTIFLKNWTLSDASTTTTFGNDSLAANAYVIVVSAGNVPLFSGYGKVISVASLPSLNNTSDIFTLRSADGKIIDQVNYDLSWYKDKTKENGGYSLEKINPTDSCHGNDNWLASKNMRGGTPGTQNSVYSILPDTIAPKLINLQITDSVTIQLVFDEALDSITAISASFILNNGSVLNNLHIDNGRKMLQLQFDKAFTPSQKISLTISDLQDCAGNKINNLQTDFTFYKPEIANRYDIIISEIMANPGSNTPLPNVEYVELYNRSGKVISLKNFRYADASTNVSLPEFLLLPDSFVVLCREADVASLLPFCRNISGLKSWPSLNNAGDSLYLRNANGELIYFINYTENMHADELKKSGGWSLELIDKSMPCAGSINYTSSKNKNGGTPGKQNSVDGKLRNFTAPEPIQLQIIDSQTLVIQFDKSIDSLTGTDTKHFSINPYIEIAKNAMVFAPDFSRVQIHLNKPIEKNKLYGLTVENISNCSGNNSEEKTLQFGLPLLPDSFDIIINEILFNPNTGGSDFVELYNRSDKILDLKDILVANSDENNQLKNIKNISGGSRLFFPGDYIVLTENPDNIKTNYQVQNQDKLLKVSSLPSMP
ncbi:MAG: lamin tail domain-containing protein, partial [Sphingobacteriales bacterium]